MQPAAIESEIELAASPGGCFADDTHRYQHTRSIA